MTRTVSGTDADGNDTFATGSVEYSGLPVWPNSGGSYTNSREATGDRDQVITGINVLFPYGADVAAIDRVTVYGLDYEVDGDPARYHNPFTGTKAGILVTLKRVTG